MRAKELCLIIILTFMAIAVPVTISYKSIDNVAFDERFYEKEFSIYRVHDDLPGYNLFEINKQVLDYLQHEKEDELIKSNFFNDREKKHLLDVKNLFNNLKNTYLTSIFLFSMGIFLLILIFNFDFRKLSEKFFTALLAGGILTLFLSILVILISFLNFDAAFGAFHEMLFPLGTYTFNQDSEKIVVLYPEILFFDLFKNILLKIILSSTIIITVSFLALFNLFGINFSAKFRGFFRRQI